MKGKTHLLAGACAAIAISAHLELDTSSTIAFVTCSTIGALVPDMDKVTSSVGRITAPASAAIQLVFGHRTILHSPLIYLLAFLLVNAMLPQHTLLYCGALLGIATHLLLDMLNPAGIPLLWPAKKRFRLASFQSGGLLDRLLTLLLSAALCVLLYHNFTGKEIFT